MPKNPVFEFFRQQGMMAKQEESSRHSFGHIPLVGERQSWKGYAQPFTYRGGTLVDQQAIVTNIEVNPHPTDVFADSSLWSPKRLDLVRQLLIATPIKILPEVRRELADIERHEGTPMKELLFPGGELNPRIEVQQYPAVKEHQYVLSRYTNLLHVRKRLFEGPLEDYRNQNGFDAKGAARTKIVQNALRAGISWRTVRLASKGDARRRFTDEVLVVYSVLSPILTGRDCFILTADRDVFDQFYQFTVLLHDDYGSFLIAQDYRQNPGAYPHSHSCSTPLMKAGAIAVGRNLEPKHLLPLMMNTCATWIIDVNTFEVFAWVSIQEIASALDFQEDVADGRVADGGDGRNVHMSIDDSSCRSAPAHFTIGEDMIRIAVQTSVGNIQLSEFDLLRITRDKVIRPR